MMRHRHRNKNRNRKKLNSKNWATAGTCLALTSTINLYSQEVSATNTNLDAQTQQAMIDAINYEYHARAFYNAVMDKFGEIRPFSNIERDLRDTFTQLRYVSQNNHKVAFERCLNSRSSKI